MQLQIYEFIHVTNESAKLSAVRTVSPEMPCALCFLVSDGSPALTA